MAKLIVRNVAQDVVEALKRRAELNGVSAEAEHRKILEAALLRPDKPTLAEILMQIPSVGSDSDFERV